MGTTEGRIYFLELETLERLEIQFFPDDITIDRNANLVNVQAVGRNIPKYQYTGGETTLPLRLDFFAEDEDRRDVMRKCKWLESLTYNEGYLSSPTRVQLIWGDMFKKEIWTVKSVVPKFSLFHKQKGLLPQQAYVDIVLALDMDYNVRRSEIRNGFTGGGGAGVDIPRSREPQPKPTSKPAAKRSTTPKPPHNFGGGKIITYSDIT